MACGHCDNTSYSARGGTKMKSAYCAALILSTFCIPTAPLAEDKMSDVDPSRVGLSPERLRRIDAWYEAQVDAGALPGAVVAIARNGKVAYRRAIGYQDHDRKIPMDADAIFWIASMTKPVTSVAAMMLLERGKLDLDAPVSRYLPDLEGMQVATEETDSATRETKFALAPQRRPMTVRDLLRHTSGLIYESTAARIHRLYGEKVVFTRDTTLADFVASLSKVPLAHQPGEVWEYSWGVDVLARVVEVGSGVAFDQFLQTRIFDPLHMVDTGFYVPEAKLDRLVDPPPGGRPAIWDVTRPPRLFSGGGGLVSTASDYLRFCQMLLNGGELDGVRILSKEPVQLMTVNSLPPNIRFAQDWIGPQTGASWGLGFAIRTNPDFSVVPGSVGSFTWGGAWGTTFWVDPVEEMIAVMMIQMPPSDDDRFGRALRFLTYAALRDSEADAFKPPATLAAVSLETIATYVGTYDFGASISTSDKHTPGPIFAGLRVETAIQDGVLRVRVSYPNGPAFKAGVMSGDTVTHIDDAPIYGLGFDQVQDKLRGPIDTPVRLKILRKDQDNPVEVSIARKSIQPSGAQLEARIEDGRLVINALGPWPFLDFDIRKPIVMQPTSDLEFYVDGGDNTRVEFITDQSGKVTGAILNPGPRQIKGFRID
jgi:CubicO group peptidase (beta-lactamase class C family)